VSIYFVEKYMSLDLCETWTKLRAAVNRAHRNEVVQPRGQRRNFWGGASTAFVNKHLEVSAAQAGCVSPAAALTRTQFDDVVLLNMTRVEVSPSSPPDDDVAREKQNPLACFLVFSLSRSLSVAAERARGESRPRALSFQQ